MNSLIKTSVQVNAHVDLIKTLILDAYRLSNDSPRPDLASKFRSTAFYYRFMRGTGHTTAIKVMLQEQTFPNSSVIFNSQSKMLEFINNTLKISSRYSAINMNSPDAMVGARLESEIIIFNDFIYFEETDKAWDFLLKNYPCFPKLKQVVFLG